MDVTLSKHVSKEELTPVFSFPDKVRHKTFLPQKIGFPCTEKLKFYIDTVNFVLRRDRRLNMSNTIHNEHFIDWIEDIYIIIIEEFFNKLFYDENGNPKDYESLDELDRAMKQLFKEKKELLSEVLNRSFFLYVNNFFRDADLSSILNYYLKVKIFREFDKDSKDLYDEKGNLRLFIEDVKDFDEERTRRIAEKIEEFIDFSGKTLKYFIEAAHMNDLRPLLMRLLQAEYFMVGFAHEIYRMLRKEVKEYKRKKERRLFHLFKKKNKPEEELILIRDYVIDKIEQIAKDLGLTIRIFYRHFKDLQDKMVMVPRDGSGDDLDACINIDNMITNLMKYVLINEKKDVFWGGNAKEGVLARYVFGLANNIPDREFYINKCVLDHEKRLKTLYNIVKEKDRITPKDIIQGRVKYFSQAMFNYLHINWEISGGFTWYVGLMFLWPIAWVLDIKIDGDNVYMARMKEIACRLSGKEYDKKESKYVCYLVQPLPYVLIDAENKNGERKPLLIGDLMTPESFKETFKKTIDLWIEYIKSLNNKTD